MIEMGEEAKMYHATLRIHGIPVFYFPFVEHPADNLGRKSGFLIPVFGTSNTRGTILGDGFYWAINRNSDAIIGATLVLQAGLGATRRIPGRGIQVLSSTPNISGWLTKRDIHQPARTKVAKN